MFTSIFNILSRSLVGLVVAMVSVNYMPDSLFEGFLFEPKSVQPLDYESVIPQNWNTLLSDNQPEFIQLNNILGPESVAVGENGLLYTGLADGRIVELDSKNGYKPRTLLRFNNDRSKCPDNIAIKASECGRFLQVKYHNDSLYAVEAHSGLYKVDTRTGSKTSLGPKTLNKISLYNCFAFDPVEPNLVYLTVSSTRRDILNIVWSLFERDSTGQVVMLDLGTGKRAVVLEGLSMPNGVDVDAKRGQLLLSETLKSSVSSVPLAEMRAAFKVAEDGGKLKEVQKKALIPLLPGLPDNIIVKGDLAYIALPMVKLNGKEFIDHLGSMPQVIRAVSRFSFGMGKALEYVCNNFYHHPLLETVYRELKCGHVFYRASQSDRSAVVEYNLATGASRLFGSNTFGYLSEAMPDGKGNLYLGSFRSAFIVKQKGLGV